MVGNCALSKLYWWIFGRFQDLAAYIFLYHFAFRVKSSIFCPFHRMSSVPRHLRLTIRHSSSSSMLVPVKTAVKNPNTRGSQYLPTLIENGRKVTQEFGVVDSQRISITCDGRASQSNLSAHLTHPRPRAADFCSPVDSARRYVIPHIKELRTLLITHNGKYPQSLNLGASLMSNGSSTYKMEVSASIGDREKP